MNIKDGLLYTQEHEWISVDGDTATMGITAFAVEQLGDIVFVELPQPGDELEQSGNVGVVESVKTVSDIFAPISGKVTEVNSVLLQEIDGEDNPEFHPEYINEDPYEKGWFLKMTISDKSQLDKLLTPEQYKEIAI